MANIPVPIDLLLSIIAHMFTRGCQTTTAEQCMAREARTAAQAAAQCRHCDMVSQTSSLVSNERPLVLQGHTPLVRQSGNTVTDC